jgi:hypothetical protein
VCPKLGWLMRSPIEIVVCCRIRYLIIPVHTHRNASLSYTH